MVQELQELTEKMTAVAESKVDFMAEVAKDSKQQAKIVSRFARIIE